MKLYTKTGDDGTTGLCGGKRLPKDAPRMEAIGAVDELNAHVGLAAATSKHDAITTVLTALQGDLFKLGADLAEEGKQRIADDAVAQVERWIDDACAPVPALQSFILPGGGELAARLHVARAVARRAERRCHSLGEQAALIYLNRVGDLLFALARLANHRDGVADVAWHG